ncbi:MAG: SH3 domain-containing protein [Chloroflexota bacterium]
MKRILLILCSLSLVLGTGIMLASAQHATPGSANLPQQPSDCAATATCPPTPVPPGNVGHSGDEDGDGIPDGIDQCPNEGGPSSNSGCPAGRSLSAGNPQAGLVTPDLSQILLPFLSATGNCELATRTGEGVNVRNQPSTSSQIVGTLDPKVTYLIISILENSSGRWYKVIPGWVSARVVRIGGGNCDTLPVIRQRNAGDANPSQLAYPDGFKLTLDKGATPGSDQPNGYCSSGYGIDVAGPGGLNNAIHIEFGDGSVQPSPVQGCFKLDSDGHGFGIEPPPDPDAQPFSIHFSVGFSPDNPNELVLIALLQAPTLPGEPPPDPDKPGVVLTWNFVPPDPCKAGDQSCDGSVRNFTVDWSQPSAANPGVAFSWNILPPDPCDTGDQTCPGGGGKQGVLINFLPAVQDVAVDFFPNGFDPSVGGFTQIENQPGSSGKGDLYGFTQIENQPLGGQIAVDFALPAVQ